LIIYDLLLTESYTLSLHDALPILMGASNAEWLDRVSRPQEENTQLAIDKIEILPTGVIADIGAGTGYYTFKLAPKVPKGKVYAVDRKSTRLNSSHLGISYAVFCLK